MFIIGAFLLTGKRGPFCFMIVSLVISEICFEKNLNSKISKILKIIFAIICSLPIIVIILHNQENTRNVLVRFNEMLTTSGGDISNGRFVLWIYAWKLFKRFPFWGVGWRHFHLLAQTNIGENIQVHNVYLQILCETGMLGFVLYIIMLVVLLKQTIKTCKNLQMVKKGIFSIEYLKLSFCLQMYIILYALTGNTLYDYCAEMMYFLAIAIYCAVSYKETYLLENELRRN